MVNRSRMIDNHKKWYTGLSTGKYKVDDHRDNLYLFTYGVTCHSYHGVWVTFTGGTARILDRHGADVQVATINTAHQ